MAVRWWCSPCACACVRACVCVCVCMCMCEEGGGALLLLAAAAAHHCAAAAAAVQDHKTRGNMAYTAERYQEAEKHYTEVRGGHFV